MIDSLTKKFSSIVKKLEPIGKQGRRIRCVQTDSVVGPRTAEILVACLDDPQRFENGQFENDRQVSACFRR